VKELGNRGGTEVASKKEVAGDGTGGAPNGETILSFNSSKGPVLPASIHQPVPFGVSSEEEKRKGRNISIISQSVREI